MAEKLVKVDVAKTVKEVVKSSIEGLSVERAPKPGAPGTPKETYKGIVEAVLQGVATRIVLTHSFKDLGQTLSDTIATVRAGGLNVDKVDMLKGRVLDTVKKIKDGHEGEAIAAALQQHFQQGKYEEAAAFLKDLSNDPDTGLAPQEKADVIGVLDKVKPENATTAADLGDLKNDRGDTRDVNEEKVKDLAEKADEIQLELGKAEVDVLIKDKKPIVAPTKRTVDDARRTPILTELATSPNLGNEDKSFIQGVLVGTAGSGAHNLDFAGMDHKEAYHIWYRTAGLLQGNNWAGAPRTEALLKEMNESAHTAVLSFATENRVLEAISPSEARFLALPKDEQDLIQGNLEFIGRTGGDVRKLLAYDQEMRGGQINSRTDAAMIQLREEYNDKNPGFDIDNKLVHNQTSHKWEWKGSREELFDVCRAELDDIQGSLTQENMSQLIFEDSAQKYLALMRIDVGDNLELESVKEAITKTLYVEYAVKTMWRSGGNMEAWQRAATVLTQESKESFFELMEIGEMLKIKDAEGKLIDVGRFNWRDLMTLAEMKAENGQYYLTYMAGQSTALQKERKPEFARALANILIDKQLLKHENGKDQAWADGLRAAMDSGGFKFGDRQVRSMVDYMQFLEVATFRGGEFGLNDVTSEAVARGKFNMTSLPCGEVVQKTGPWSVIYDWYYPVTKYGGEWVGKIFLPNVNILSYRRGETLGHLIAKDTKVAAGMMDKTGNYHDTGVGAKDFFFGGSHDDEAKEFTEFWGDVIFDTRTGEVINKTAINRTVDSARGQGRLKLAVWKTKGQLGFVNSLRFDNFEALIGHTVPGNSNLEKFEWMVNNFDYSFWRADIMPSKAVGDWVTKYVPKKYEEARTKLADFLNAPGTATLGAVRDIISEYSDESTFHAQAQAALEENRKNTVGVRKVDDDGNEENILVYDPHTGQMRKEKNLAYNPKKGKLRLVGYKNANPDRSKVVWKQEGSGDYWGVVQQWHSPFEGWHPGSGIATSRQQGKELFRDPMYFEKLELDNQFHAGLLSRKDWGKAKREWLGKAYFGEKIGNTPVRLGYFPLLTPFYVFRGFWVDRWQLDWEDFLIATRKNNQETWEKLKKVIGI